MFPRLIARSVPLLVAAFAVAACATRSAPSESYSDRIENETPPRSSERTVVLFLVDGLSTSILRQELSRGKLPQIERHFLGGGRKIGKAHSVFPSLTFPNISALLHEVPVHRTGNTGNSVIVNRRLLDFESVLDRREFSRLMTGKTVFTRLAEKGQRSVSLDYGLGVDALVSSDAMDVKAGVALELKDYEYLDQKKIDSLVLLLKETPAKHWPEFIFVHLVGLDFLSHTHGPRSKIALDYLVFLDRAMGPVLQLLRRADAESHKTVSMLTADHGFPLNVREFTPIEELVKKISPELKVLNEVRFAALYAPATPSEEELGRVSRRLLRERGIQLVAARRGSKVWIRSGGKVLSFSYVSVLDCPDYGFGISIDGAAAVCPRQLDPSVRKLFGPFFIENVAAYFQAEKYPDLLVIPNELTVFKKSAVAGYHGGATEDEVVVPLLLRNATMEPGQVPALWKLLRLL